MMQTSGTVTATNKPAKRFTLVAYQFIGSIWLGLNIMRPAVSDEADLS